MQRRTSRTLSRAVIVAVILAVGATIWQSWTAGMPGMSGVVATQWGPLSPADRDLIVKVRLACLWEMSTGQQVQQQATNPAVKEAGRKISAEHTELDQKTRDIADKLGVPLPASPNAQQLGWMKEIASKTGSDYDRTAVQRLREAHGIVLPLLAEVRISTRNDLVRQFAADGTLYVTRHIGYLESTGLVDYSALPEPQSPGLLSGAANWTDLLVPGLVLIACLLAATLIGASLRGRGKANKAAQLPPMVTTSAPRVATAAALIALAGGGQHGPVGEVQLHRHGLGDVAGDVAGRDSRRPDPGPGHPAVPGVRQRAARRPSLAARPARPARLAPRSAAHPEPPAPRTRLRSSLHAVRSPALPLPSDRSSRPAPSGDGPNPDRGSDAAPSHVPLPARPPPPRRLRGRGCRHDRADRVQLRRCRPDGHAHSLGAHGRHEHGRPGPAGRAGGAPGRPRRQPGAGDRGPGGRRRLRDDHRQLGAVARRPAPRRRRAERGNPTTKPTIPTPTGTTTATANSTATSSRPRPPRRASHRRPRRRGPTTGSTCSAGTARRAN